METRLHPTPERALLIEDFFDVSDLLLDLAFALIQTAVVLQVRVVRRFANAFLHLASNIFHRALSFILGTRFHEIASVEV